MVRKRSHFGPNDVDNEENVINLMEYFNPDISEVRKSIHPIEPDQYVISIEPRQKLD